MSDRDLQLTASNNPASGEMTEPGFLSVEEKQDNPLPAVQEVQPSQVKPPAPPQALERTQRGTVEHLAARRPMPQLDSEAPAIKQRLVELRAEVTRLVTALRWQDLPEGKTGASFLSSGASRSSMRLPVLSVEEAAEQMIPLLNVGPVSQWKSILMPFLFEIDRAGNLLPVWLHIIKQEDPPELSPGANPAETPVGRARRFAILMLGYYKYGERIEQDKKMGFSQGRSGLARVATTAEDLVRTLSQLALDPTTSLYATQSLARMSTNLATQALLKALSVAEGWAKVDIVEALLSLKLVHFHDILLASGLDRVPGLESYVAIPIYRAVPLEQYLRSGRLNSPRLSQQAALIFAQVLQNSMTPPSATSVTGAATTAQSLPVIFERDLSVLASTLFEEARTSPCWQNVLAVHYFGLFMGRYWSEIARGTLRDPRIVDAISVCLPMMNEVERWMNGPGRDVLLDTLADTAEETELASLTPLIKVLGEMREPRAVAPLMSRLESVRLLTDRAQALALDAICTALGRIGDRRATVPMLQLVNRVVDVGRRMSHARRRDNLPPGDADIPGSIVYAAVIRACGLMADPHALDSSLRAIRDFDPYVRTQAAEALKRIDPTGQDIRSRQAAREALADPRESVVRAALQLVVQYRDFEALTLVHQVSSAHPTLAQAVFDTLRQLGQ
ncbi:MAG: HEAT repeat domain-containing protein [Ktedonobacteraceae bacterium]|nr:HEAT repeat domain-containing protein [Ktedonobacteraceae bacterium]